jgi:probable rRNA maturation factor
MSRSVKPLNRCIVTSVVKSADSAIQRFNNPTILIANRQRTKKINTRLLRKIVLELFRELKISGAELGINLIAVPEMTVVNETFLQHAGPTDVITFSYANPESGILNSESQLHGELFVCVDEAVSQAKYFKASWQTEIVRYVVHGVLHLLGHDDLKPALRRKMKREENRLVRLLAKRFSLAQRSGAAKLGR